MIWLIAIALGLLAFLALAMFRWADAQRSFWWRLLFCFIAAAALTPGFENNGHSQGWSFPIVLAFPDGLIPIAVHSVVLAVIWSVILCVRHEFIIPVAWLAAATIGVLAAHFYFGIGWVWSLSIAAFLLLIMYPMPKQTGSDAQDEHAA